MPGPAWRDTRGRYEPLCSLPKFADTRKHLTCVEIDDALLVRLAAMDEDIGGSRFREPLDRADVDVWIFSNSPSGVDVLQFDLLFGSALDVARVWTV